jgi:hypothetical protein
MFPSERSVVEKTNGPVDAFSEGEDVCMVSAVRPSLATV